MAGLPLNCGLDLFNAYRMKGLALGINQTLLLRGYDPANHRSFECRIF